MTPDGTPDHQLHNFLTAARARLRPEDIGIRPPANRRGCGLHQSDLADALVVSDRWHLPPAGPDPVAWARPACQPFRTLTQRPLSISTLEPPAGDHDCPCTAVPS